jgi:integrase
MHRVLYTALNQAERWRLINRNPAALLEKRDRPKIDKKPVRTIDAAATAAAFDAARERRLFIPLILATLCGMRRGEITALRWRSIDLDNGQLAVVASTEQTDAGAIREKEAKSGKARTVACPRWLSRNCDAGGWLRPKNCSAWASEPMTSGTS